MNVGEVERKASEVLLLPLRVEDLAAVSMLRMSAEQAARLPKTFGVQQALMRWELKAHAPRYDYHARVIWKGQERVGFVGLLNNPRCDIDTAIVDFIIDLPQQGKGIGTAALRAGVEVLKEEFKACRVMIYCDEGNDVARAVYRKVGFKGYRPYGISTLVVGDCRGKVPWLLRPESES